MTHDDIIRMAREAGLGASLTHGISEPVVWIEFTDWHDEVERFAALVAAHEREACAKECETLLPSQRIFDHRYYGAVGDCVATIRARGEEPKRHPGYIVGDHWLQAAYTRICTGETEAEVMADYGWKREA